MSATPFTPRRISFENCRTDEEAMDRLERLCDELDDENTRRYAADLLEREPDIDNAEFQHCLVQFRAFLVQWREEHRAERHEVFQQMLDAARRLGTERSTRGGKNPEPS
jgi:hypothetical protein